MDKPKMKTEVGIDWIGEATRVIALWANDDALSELANYGRIATQESTWPVRYLHVDARFDFSDVVEYIRNYDSQQPDPPEWLE